MGSSNAHCAPAGLVDELDADIQAADVLPIRYVGFVRPKRPSGEMGSFCAVIHQEDELSSFDQRVVAAAQNGAKMVSFYRRRDMRRPAST
jgi:hypothetical protein